MKKIEKYRKCSKCNFYKYNNNYNFMNNKRRISFFKYNNLNFFITIYFNLYKILFFIINYH